MTMNLIPWKSKREERGLARPEFSMSRLRSEMDRLFDRFMGEPLGFPWSDDVNTALAWGPQIDLSETEKDVTVRAELAGVDPKDVEINVAGNVLTLRGEKRQEHEEKKRDYHYVERQYGSFHRSIPLPSYVNADQVEANFRNGVLTVTLAKRPEAQAKRIEIKQG